MQRGKPQTLVLHRLKPPASKLRAPGPGAVRKVEWKPLAAKWLKDRQVILHTDSAKSYASKISGVLHDRVVHKKKRVKVNGKFKWVAPTYVKIQKHKIPGTKKTLRVKSGTQIVDRCWRCLKERLNINQHAKVGSRIQLCSAQYEYWPRGQDLWTATGSWSSGSWQALLEQLRHWGKTGCVSAVCILASSTCSRFLSSLCLLACIKTTNFHMHMPCWILPAAANFCIQHVQLVVSLEIILYTHSHAFLYSQKHVPTSDHEIPSEQTHSKLN